MRRHSISPIAALILQVFLAYSVLGASCLFPGSSSTVDTGPKASAGADQTAEQDLTVTLDGSGSSPGGVTFQWEQTSGTTVPLSDTTAIRPSFPAPSSAGELVFLLTVTDASGSATDTTTVTVTADPTLVGPFSDISGSSVKSLEDMSLNAETVTSSRTSPYEANRLDVSGAITPASGSGIFIRCNELVLDGTASFRANGDNGTSGAGANGGAAGSGTGCGSGGGGGAGSQFEDGGGGGSGGDGMDGGMTVGTAGSGGTGTGSTDADGYTYGDGGAGANGSPNGGLGGGGGMAYDGGGGGGGGGGSSLMDGHGGGGCGAGLVVVVCNSVTGTGTAQAIGGNGLDDGGGGGGGVIWSAFGSYSNAITTDVSGGSGGATVAEDGMAFIFDLNLTEQGYGDTW